MTQAESGAAVPRRRQQPPLRCTAKGCGAPSAEYATGSYFDRAGKRDFLLRETICINGHSALAHRLDLEEFRPEPPAIQAAPVAPNIRAMFDRVVTTRYDELSKIAENALDSGKIPGAGDCVQQAIAALLLQGSYASCADEGEMFGQLVVTVRNRAKRP
jgi:hypothetical protein